MTAAILAAEFPPTINEFYPPALVKFSLLGLDFEITRITLISWIAIVALLIFFLAASRNPKVVPGKLQFAGEGVYGFVRQGIARDVIGPHGLPYAPFLASLFAFILANNVMGVIPFAQIAPTAKFAMPLVLAVVSYVVFIAIGIKRQGVAVYFRDLVYIREAPLGLQPLLLPIEIFQKLVARPFTLAIRLFANMFAGHLLLLVFTLGGVALINQASFGLKVASLGSWAFALVFTFFELGVQILQAYVFTLLTATYIQESVEGGH